MLNVSIVIPTYNRKKLLARCLENASKDVEVIVVDDGSSDGTPEEVMRIEHPCLKYVKQANSGPAAARNTGIRAYPITPAAR